MGSQIEENCFKPPQHVVVVGAGIIGATLGWYLTRDGANVTIIANEVGGTATPCSFAWLNASWNNPRFYYDFRLRSMAGWKTLADEVPQLQRLLQWKGGLGVSWSSLASSFLLLLLFLFFWYISEEMDSLHVRT